MSPTSPRQKFDHIAKQVVSYNPNFDVSKLERAFEFAQIAHSGQTRLSADPFITHPLAVTQILADWRLDNDSLAAGLLHDTIEDGGATRDDLIKIFGEEVTRIVDGVTKITQIRLKGKSEAIFAENLRKMLLVMAKDLRVVMVKLADRLHNMRTLEYLPQKKQEENAKETLEIYAPLAERLGIGDIKGQLEDLSFPYLYPQEHSWIKKYSTPYFKLSKTYIEKFRDLLNTNLKSLQGVYIQARAKHLYSLYRKLLRPEIDRDITKIHDLIAVRIITQSTEDCYITLGIIHGLFRPVPYIGIRDFIANPKPNGYRSIHTNIFGPGGKIVEIQIRSQKMHEEAEMGIAAHWNYSQVKNSGVQDEKLEKGQVNAQASKLAWVKQLIVWQKEITDSEEFLNALKFDALNHRNLVFSPKGDVYDLPRNATPIDFAYAVHTRLGDQAIGAKVNNKLVSLNRPLTNGDVVEIVLNRNKKLPSRDWLKFIVTTKARHEILRALKETV